MRTTTLSLVAGLAAAFLAGCAGSEAEERLPDPGNVARPSTVGVTPYDGPRDAQSLMAHCNGGGYDNFPCYTETLQAYLQSAGSIAAFDLLDDLTRVDTAVNTQAHTLSHELGKHALKVYGTIERTLQDCSYEVFQGCLHGALQAYFDSLPELTPEMYSDICPTDTRFKEYACLHGLGHGLVLYNRYNVTTALAQCDVLTTDFARGSCHGGAFMENMVAYMDHENAGGAAGHDHGAMGNVTYMIDPGDPYYPCNAVDEKYQQTCWLLQTSLITYLNNKQGMSNDENFRAASQACADAPDPHSSTCFRSLGRDASAYANSACGARATRCYVDAVTTWCANAEGENRGLCIKGVVAEVVLNFAEPGPGRQTCALVSTIDEPACYEELGVQAANMLDRAQVAAFCDQAEPTGVQPCRRGAGL